jgi:hypothetical protein
MHGRNLARRAEDVEVKAKQRIVIELSVSQKERLTDQPTAGNGTLALPQSTRMTREPATRNVYRKAGYVSGIDLIADGKMKSGPLAFPPSVQPDSLRRSERAFDSDSEAEDGVAIPAGRGMKQKQWELLSRIEG